MSASNLAVSKTGLLRLRPSLVYLLIGIGIGITMGAAQSFGLRPIHAHVNLLGGALAAIAGITYCLMPQAGERPWSGTFLATQHWLPVMLISLTMVLS